MDFCLQDVGKIPSVIFTIASVDKDKPKHSNLTILILYINLCNVTQIINLLQSPPNSPPPVSYHFNQS